MEIVLHTGSFEDYLSVVFDIYSLRLKPDCISSSENYHAQLFDVVHQPIFNENQAKRVWKALCKKLSTNGQKVLYYAFLSEAENIDLDIYRVICRTLESTISIEQDFGDPHVLRVWQESKKVAREIHRIIMFVRFQKTTDGIYYASFDPMYDVLPFSTDHFTERFTDQRWVIYDTRRNYGFYYNGKTPEEISFTDSIIDFKTGRIKPEALASDELDLQRLWKIYFTEMAIKERKNLKLQRQHMPKRFWKYLVEKWQ